MNPLPYRIPTLCLRNTPLVGTSVSCINYIFDSITSFRYETLLQWQKNNPGATFNDLVEAFQRAERPDMVDVTCQVAKDSNDVPPLVRQCTVRAYWSKFQQ